MLSEKVAEKLAEELVDRIEELNLTIITEIGKTIKEIGTLTPSQAYKLIQDMKYGGSYNKIIKKLAEVTSMNEKEIYKIFEKIAKENSEFSKQFFEYRNIDYIPYEENIRLQDQVRAMAKVTAGEYKNLMNTTAYMVIENGEEVYTPLSQIYQKTLDTAVIALVQGKETYQATMKRTMEELTDKGMRVVNYKTGYHRRLDSAVRMNILDGMRDVSNTTQEIFAEQYGSDAVEISVHLNPAPDHAPIQGRQYTNEQFEKMQGKRSATGMYIGGTLKRPISTMNCYHYIFRIIKGVSKPLYTEEQLKEINAKNIVGFTFEGKHYTNYEGTQLQRKIETEVRRLSEKKIGAETIGETDEAGNYERKINQLKHKYTALAKASGLPAKYDRMQVKGYRRITV